MGMCIVDVHRLFCNLQNERYTDVDILEFSDLICKKLVVGQGGNTRDWLLYMEQISRILLFWSRYLIKMENAVLLFLILW
jgi:hypothetical protein